MNKTTILNLDDSPYENGKVSGEYFKKNVNINFERIKTILNENIEIRRKVELQLEKLRLKFPKYYDEVCGKADGLEVDILVYFGILCPEILDLNFEHCTTIICKNNKGNYIISHNEDDEYLNGNFCLSKVKIDNNNWFVTNDMYNMPFGNGISWNSYGILKTINYCHDDNVKLEYLPRYFSQRHISEASSIDDMIQRCKEIKISSGYHINAIDINNNIAVSIEVHNDYVDVEYIKDVYIHSNHFIHKNNIENFKVDNGSNSIFRFNYATKLLSQSYRTELNDIKKILQYRSDDNLFEKSIFQTKQDPYETIFNFSYDNENKIYLDVYVNNEKIILDYNNLAIEKSEL